MCSMNDSLQGNYLIWDNFIFLSKDIHMEINSGKTNKTVHLKMYKLLGAKSEVILVMRRIVWWTFKWNICPVFALPLHYLVTIEKELICSAKKPIFHEKSSTISWNFWINQHQVIFLTYRMYNPTVQSVRSLLKIFGLVNGWIFGFYPVPSTTNLKWSILKSRV